MMRGDPELRLKWKEKPLRHESLNQIRLPGSESSHCKKERPRSNQLRGRFSPIDTVN
jgi:hypothetical protein